jgi:hypothetical protein
MSARSFFLLVSLLTVAATPRSSNVSDITPIAIADPAERAAVSAATDRLLASGSAGDLTALELLVGEFRPNARATSYSDDVVATIGRGVSYGFGDPVKQRACDAIRGPAYSVDFLEEAIRTGSSRVALWGLKTLIYQQERSGNFGPTDAADFRDDARHWEEENRSAEVQSLIAAHGIVSKDFLRRIAPWVKKLSESRDSKLKEAAAEFFDFYSWIGLFYQREEILAELAKHRSDETALERIIGDLNEDVGMDLKISPEIWDILLHAKDRQLVSTALRYRWLFCLPAFSEDKQHFIEQQLAAGDGGGWPD